MRACVAATCSAYSAVWWVNLGRSDRDLNGDGYADIVVGAPYNVDAVPGHAYVYLGGSGGPDATPDAILIGESEDDSFGAVASGGDLNGDGFADLAVGAPGGGWSGEGRVYVYWGGPGDSFDDQPEAVLLGTAPSDHFGGSVALAGDVNRDGVTDLIVGADEYYNPATTRSGRAEVFFGAAGTNFDSVADATLRGDGDGAAFGRSVDCAGDVNGDGAADVIVGAPYWDALGGEYVGRAYVFFGGEATFDPVADGVLTGSSSFTYLAWGTASAGDVDDDGYSDVLVGAIGPGTTFVYLGGPGATFDAAPDAQLPPDEGSSGWSLSSAGDVNADGFSDVVLGSPDTSNDTGWVNVYYGGVDGLDTVAEGKIGGAAGYSGLGWSVSAAGDVNSDAFDDLIVGAIGVDSYTGRAYVYFGSPGSSFDGTEDGTFVGETGVRYYGGWVATRDRSPAHPAYRGRGQTRPSTTVGADRPWASASRATLIPPSL